MANKYCSRSRPVGKVYKTTGHHGNATWLSSNINLVNTSMSAAKIGLNNADTM